MSNCPHCKAENDAPLVKIASDNSTEGDQHEVDCENCEALYWVTYTVNEQSWCKHPDHVWEPWVSDWETKPFEDYTKECAKCGTVMTQECIDMEDKFYQENK